MAYRVFLGLMVFIFACEQPTSKDQPSTKIMVETKAHLSPEDRYGELFTAVQLAEVFPDSKTFVDCIPKMTTDQLMEQYEIEKNHPDFDLAKFVHTHFDLPVKRETNFITDTTHDIEAHIEALWPILTVEVVESDGSSLLNVPKPYVVPGGRFSELYYWDSYFISLGLETSGLVDLMENQLDNFTFLIDQYGFVPNGNRTYFLSRSHPPVLSMMVKSLAQKKGDEVYLKYLPTLQKEYQFWMDGLMTVSRAEPTYRRLVRMDDGSVLNRYWDDQPLPRAESYREDVALAKELSRPAEELYRDIRAACESGWDFSSRWFKDGQYMASIQTTSLIPVDLNCLLYHLESVLAKSYALEGNNEEADLFTQRAQQRYDAIQRYCWDEDKQFFLDYNFIDRRTSPQLSLAGIFPLYFGVSKQNQADSVAQKIQSDFLKKGGVITTLTETEQQWDAPNGWAPLQWITIQGLQNYGANDLADTIKTRWIDLNEKVFKRTGKIMEKYNVIDLNSEAGGGEYELQDGFGWSNGVLSKLMSEKKNPQ